MKLPIIMLPQGDYIDGCMGGCEWGKVRQGECCFGRAGGYWVKFGYIKVKEITAWVDKFDSWGK